MGGRGSSSGITTKAGGFEFTSGGKKFTVQRTAAGVTLVNGNPSKISFESLQKSAKAKSDYKEISEAEFERRRIARYEDYTSHDYELSPGGVRGLGKTVYRPRRSK